MNKFYCFGILFFIGCLSQYIFIKIIGYDPGLELGIIPVVAINIFINVILSAVFVPNCLRKNSIKVFFVYVIVIAFFNFCYVCFFSKGKSPVKSGAAIESPVYNDLDVHLKLIATDSKIIDGLITIAKNNRPYKEILSQGKECAEKFDLNSFYLIRCAKKGYITKVIYFDTRIPKGRERNPFAKFEAEIKLNLGSSKIPIYSGGVNYDKVEKDFDKVGHEPH